MAKTNMYVDFVAGVWCTALRHNYPQINQVMKKQINQIIYLDY